MIRTSRRGMMSVGAMGALAVPTLAGLASWRWKHGEQAVLVHDSSLAAGRAFAAAAKGANVQEITGDRVRFTREILAASPAMIAGVSRYADLFMIADVAREAGYDLVATLDGRQGRCTAQDCRPGWGALGRLGQSAGGNWVQALADFASQPRGGVVAANPLSTSTIRDSGLVLGWVLARRG